MVKASRVLMVFGRFLAGSLATPSGQLSGRASTQSLRLPGTVVEPPKSPASRVHIRIPGTYAPRRSKLALRSHLVALGLGLMQPDAKRSHSEAEAPQRQQPQKVTGRKRKAVTPELEVRVAIQMAAREGDVHKALQTYDAAKKRGVKISVDSYASILYLCSGGDDWESALQQAPPGDDATGDGDGGGAPPRTADCSAAPEGAAATQPEVPERRRDAPVPTPTPDLLARGGQLLDDMQQAGLTPNEMCYTALARIAALRRAPEEALARARDVLARGLPPRLRCFAPALVGFAEAGEGAKAFEVDAAIAAVGLEAGEAEFARLLQAASTGGVPWHQAESVLHRMGRELTVLQPGTLVRLRQFFSSAAALAAFDAVPGEGCSAGGAAGADAAESPSGTPSSSQPNGSCRPRQWKLETCTVSSSGECRASCGGTLAALDLSSDEYAEFLSGIVALARRQERQPTDFAQFVEWVAAHGPFGAVVDAANVAFYGQNFESGGFTFAQIRAVVEHLKVAHAELRPLVILHVNRTRAPHPSQRAVAAALLEELQRDGCFYATPTGSNDDWYWIYAAVAAGRRGLLVSNDEMRDHLFQLLAPRYFSKWKQRHQLRFRFGAGGSLSFDYPPPYTTCAQRLASGAWVFPGAGSNWLCAVPAPAAGVAVAEVAAAEAQAAVV